MFESQLRKRYCRLRHPNCPIKNVFVIFSCLNSSFVSKLVRNASKLQIFKLFIVFTNVIRCFVFFLFSYPSIDEGIIIQFFQNQSNHPKQLGKKILELLFASQIKPRIILCLNVITKDTKKVQNSCR